MIFENHRSRENTVVAKRRRKVAPFVSAGALLVVACGLAVGLAGSNPGHPLTGLLANRSGAIQTAECPQEIEARAGIECAMLNAFEHTDGSGAAIRLPFAILRSTASSPPPDPVLMIGGGPGPNLVNLVGAAQSDLPFLRSRNVIIPELRGTGVASPSLACPEMEGHATIALDGRTIDEAVTEILDATKTCAARVRADGTDRDAYLTSDRVRDLIALRKGLEIPAWNVYGTSYGTLVAIELLAADGGAVRSAVLDGVLPPGADLFHEIGRNGRAALEVALAGCETTSSCGGQGLLGRYDALAAKLERAPIKVEVVDPWTADQRRRSASVDGESLEKGVFGLLYSNDANETLPQRILAAGDGDLELLQQGVIAQLWWTRGDFGAFLSQHCAEGGWDGTTDDLSAAFADLPQIAGDAWERHREVHASQCDLWGVRPRARANPVKSDVPTLLLVGAFDPITPPRWAAEVAGSMSTATLRVFAGTGHGVLFGGPPCADEIAAAFVGDPRRQLLDSDCGLPVIP